MISWFNVFKCIHRSLHVIVASVGKINVFYAWLVKIPYLCSIFSTAQFLLEPLSWFAFAFIQVSLCSPPPVFFLGSNP